MATQQTHAASGGGDEHNEDFDAAQGAGQAQINTCLLYTSDAADE